MSGAPKSRGMLQYVFKHFMESFKVGKRQQLGSIMGKDPYGNSYYELPAQPQLGKRRPTRWYNTKDVSKGDAESGPSETWGGFDQELPAEWESWLRHRRAEPPTEKEVLQSLALSQMKKINAAKLEETRREEMTAAGLDPAPPGQQDHEKTPYPKYADYEITPGDLEEKGNRGKWDTHKNPFSKEH